MTELADQLAERFIEIQKRIVSFADSFYWLRYLSPKRGDREHRLEIRVKENQHDFVLWGEFNSRDFHSARPRVLINQSQSNSEGTKKLRIAAGDTVRFQAVTYPDLKIPQYRWESSDGDIVAIHPDPNDASVAWAIAAVGDSGQTATLSVTDGANELARRVEVEVLPPRFLTLPEGAIVTLPGGVSLEMVFIKPGTFQMGSPPSEEGVGQTRSRCMR